MLEQRHAGHEVSQALARYRDGRLFVNAPSALVIDGRGEDFRATGQQIRKAVVQVESVVRVGDRPKTTVGIVVPVLLQRKKLSYFFGVEDKTKAPAPAVSSPLAQEAVPLFVGVGMRAKGDDVWIDEVASALTLEGALVHGRHQRICRFGRCSNHTAFLLDGAADFETVLRISPDRLNEVRDESLAKRLPQPGDLGCCRSSPCREVAHRVFDPTIPSKPHAFV